MRRFVVLSAMICACGSTESGAPDVDAGLPTFEVSSPEQAQHLPARVRGNLAITGAELSGKLRIEQLQTVEGELRVSAPALKSLELPQLTHVTRDCDLSHNHALEDWLVPKLESCGGSLVLWDNRKLAELSGPALASASDLSIQSNAALQTVSLPVLDLVAQTDLPAYLSDLGLYVKDNPALEELELPALRSLAELTVTSNTLLRRVSLPAAEGPASLQLWDNHLLEELSLPELVGIAASYVNDIRATSLRTLRLTKVRELPGLYSVWSDSLQALELPALETVEDLTLITPSLERFEAPKLTEAGQLRISGRRLQQVALPRLAGDCGGVHIATAGGALPDCAAADVLPGCKPKDLDLQQGCRCDPDGDLSAAACPDAGP